MQEHEETIAQVKDTLKSKPLYKKMEEFSSLEQKKKELADLRNFNERKVPKKPIDRTELEDHEERYRARLQENKERAR